MDVTKLPPTVCVEVEQDTDRFVRSTVPFSRLLRVKAKVWVFSCSHCSFGPDQNRPNTTFAQSTHSMLFLVSCSARAASEEDLSGGGFCNRKYASTSARRHLLFEGRNYCILMYLSDTLPVYLFLPYYRKRGSASYIVREVLSVRERERERERERYRDRRK